MQAHEVVFGERLAAVQDLPRPRVGGARLFLLLVRETQDTQREQLVYLSAVKEVAGALRRDLRVVIKDYRRGENGTPVALIPSQHRPRLHVLTLFSEPGKLLRRVHERDELAALGSEYGVSRDERPFERLLPILAAPRRGVHYLHCELEQTFTNMLRTYFDRSFEGLPTPHQSPDNLPAGVRQRLLLDTGGDRDGGALGLPNSVGFSPSTTTSRSAASSQAR